MSVLVITKSDDHEGIGQVLDFLREDGMRVVRMDTDRFPLETSLSMHYTKGGEKLVFQSEEGEFDLREVTSVWYRRLNAAGRLPADMERQLRAGAVHETRLTILGMVASLKAFHLDPFHHVRHAESKQLQLQLAKELGIDIPRTLITNDPASARAFYDECRGEVVTKMMASFAVYDAQNREKVVFTTALKPEDMGEALLDLRFCPMTFQERVPKSVELRATIVGNKVFTAAVDSQKSADTKVDWRRDGLGLIDSWVPYDLPKEVEERLLGLMAHFRLNYGAADFVVTPDGRHVFLEVNPVGEFFWLDKFTGLPISRAIAGILAGHGRRVF
ncbi:MAG: MvdD family ATP-grasp ribosomal peptide maturase [Deltaproteobacteria bacterium]|nr:MvdD family ATP-grasp ribosomal peptide maturase [Deltaproteobacteria bacterium]